MREWLAAQAAGGFITYDPASQTYALPPEQAMALADENSPVFLPGFFEIVEASVRDVPKITDAFRTGKGVGWHEHDACLFTGTERFFRPNYRAHLIKEWIPALGDTEAKLKAGASVADVGCGLGTSTILMAQAYPKSKFVGFDYHPRSIELAREAAAKAGLSDRVKFEVAKAKDFPGKGFQLVAFFDCLHDMGDPEGAARHVFQSLAPDGAWMIVEPFAGDKLEDNLNPNRAGVLCGFDHAVHAGFAFAGSRTGPGRAGGRRTPGEDPEVSWVQPGAPRRRNAFQHRAGGESVSDVSIDPEMRLLPAWKLSGQHRG